MRFTQVRDVLDHAQAFHKRLSEFYQDLADHEDATRIKMLLDHIARHERQLEKCLKDYEESASKQILDTWFQYSEDELSLTIPDDIAIKPHMSVQDVIRIGLELDDRIIKVYNDAAASADVPEVREVFDNLLSLEKQEQHHLVMVPQRNR